MVKNLPSAASSAPSPSPPPPPCSSFSTPSSSCSTTSTISAATPSSSLASSIDSSSSSTSSSSPSPSDRCPGLDLLVKAIHQVTAGSIIGVPYIQKRVIRRRSRRRETFLNFEDHSMIVLSEMIGGNSNAKSNNNALLKRQRRVMAVPTKYQDSVLQTWKPKSRYGRDLSKLVMK